MEVTMVMLGYIASIVLSLTFIGMFLSEGFVSLVDIALPWIILIFLATQFLAIIARDPLEKKSQYLDHGLSLMCLLVGVCVLVLSVMTSHRMQINIWHSLLPLLVASLLDFVAGIGIATEILGTRYERNERENH